MLTTNFAHPVASSNVAATSWGDSIEREMVRSKSPFPVPESDSDFHSWRDEILCGEVNDGNAFHVFEGISSHAGLFSTASDLLQYGESLLQSMDGEGYFAPEVIKLFMTQGPDAHQSLGFRSWTDSFEGCTEEFYGHTGFPGTVLAISFKHDFVATLLTNRLHVTNTPENTEDLWRPLLSEIHRKLHK
jgi:CubicO group peptidase (beta-lactamase class C family)